LRLIYSAADLFVLPSLEDNLPQTGMEAMSCGTPVVAFAAGGIPDYVRPEQTGLLAPVGDSEALAQQLRRLVETPELAGRLGANARKMILAEFQQPIESARYLELLGSILATRRSVSRAA
jgi:glycosyltransferase involved in cell wall biosynthesis